MNDLQKKELEILLEIDRVCNEHNIRYFLSSGTMLGAIRHHGFIPWDDDIDIIMDIKDYWRFCEIAPGALGKNFFLQSTDTDLWYKSYSKVRYNNTTMIEETYKGINFHHGVWVDIFPIMGIEKNQKSINRINTVIRLSDWLVYDAFFDPSLDSPGKLRLLLKLPLRIRRAICKAIRKLAFKSSAGFTYCDYYWGRYFDSPRFKTEDFKEVIRVPFEGHLLPIPKEYDKILKSVYGDYMTPPPPEHRNSGHIIEILDLDKDYTHYLK
ncbi:MAG: LicD family protein [Clostridia bacterium]|nr:LicD family protein [Clostridia bacterium]